MLVSPLRYPGGKAKLYPFFVDLIKNNNLFGADYCEPYAGGAGLALKLLGAGFVDRIFLNDIDETIYAFWRSVLEDHSRFCDLIEATPITIDEWHKQKEIRSNKNNVDILSLGFSTYFLNRTNRSGIIENAGPIGGHNQTGQWKIDARFNKAKQISIIQAIAQFSSQIIFSNDDALKFIKTNISGEKCLTYLDPPYYVKANKLYRNFYTHSDHEKIAKFLGKKRNCNWLVSYDDVEEIRTIYSKFEPFTYSLNYSAGRKIVGKEVIFLSDQLALSDSQLTKGAA